MLDSGRGISVVVGASSRLHERTARKLTARRSAGNRKRTALPNPHPFRERTMKHIVIALRPAILRWPALFGLFVIGSALPRSVWSQTTDSLAPPPSQTPASTAPRPSQTPGSESRAPSQTPDSLSLLSGETKANPFSGFETHYLSNGLKVWYKRLPDAPDVSVSVGVPYGWDMDPRGKEELAHLTEHVLFSDHDGRTEQEIKNDLDAIGGRYNGYTTPDHTWYYATVSKEHGSFALQWLSRVVSPHAMDVNVVDRNRTPVALEMNAQPRQLFESAWALLNPSWLLPPDFWQREFGMDTRNARRYDRWESLQRITAEDIVDFYDRYYVPEAMTLTVIGDLDRNEVMETAERAFGSLAQRPVPPRDVAVEDPARQRATFYWGFGPNVRYTARHKFFNTGADDDLMLLFIQDLLRHRLNRRLRYEEQKAVYGLQVTTAHRGPGGFLQIQGSIAEDEYDFAQAIVQEELATLREGTLPAEEFEADRTALVERLRGETSTAQALNFWVLRNFYDPSKHTDFPDLLSFFDGVTQAEVATFAARTLVPERAVTTLVRVQPVGQVILAIAALTLMLLTVRAVAWALKRPVTMAGILYVARFRVPVLLQVATIAIFGTVALVFGRLIVSAVQSLALTSLVTVDQYSIQMVFYATMLMAAVVLFVLYLSLFPRKVLVFPDHLLIKFLAYRSRLIKPDDLLELSTRRVHQVWFKKILFRTVPLAWGVVGPGIYMRPTKGRAYFFRSRNTRELADVLGGWRGSSVLPAASKSVRKKPVSRDPFQELQETSDWIAEMAPDPIRELEESSIAIDPTPLPEIEEPSTSITLDPLPGIEAPSSSNAPAGSEPLPGLDGPSDSIIADPLPGLEGPSDAIVAESLPGMDGETDPGEGGMSEDELKDLLGNAYDPNPDKKF